MKPAQLRCAGAQIERVRPAAKHHLGLGQMDVAFRPRARSRRTRRQIARGSEGGPGLAILAVEPAAQVRQPDRRIQRLDPRAVGGTDALERDDIHLPRGHARRTLVNRISPFSMSVRFAR
jgi:hypothetical protein